MVSYLTDLYDATYPSASGKLDGWTNPVTGSGSAIQGVPQFQVGEVDYDEPFMKALYLVDYYVTYVMYTADETDRSGIGTPILVGDSVPSRLEYLWDIVKSSAYGLPGNIQQAVSEWQSQILASGNMTGTDYLSYASASGQPEIVLYELDAPKYLDNYDGLAVNLYDLKTGSAVDLSVGDLDSLSAPTVSGGYYSELSGKTGYFEERDSYLTLTGSGGLSVANLWTDNGLDGLFGSSEINPDNPLIPTSGSAEPTAVWIPNASGGNHVARDAMQKMQTYLTRQLNEFQRVTYGQIQGFETDIPDATGQHNSIKIQDGQILNASGSWPVETNALPTLEPDPTGGSMYDFMTPDYRWMREVDQVVDDDDPDYGAIPYLLSEMRELRYRLMSLGASGSMGGGRLFRTTMPVYQTRDSLPASGDAYFLADRSDIDGVVKVGDSWYWYDHITTNWRIAWTTDAAEATASGVLYGDLPYGNLTGSGVTALPSVKDVFPSVEYRDRHIAPGLYVYDQILRDVIDEELDEKLVDQDVVDDKAINLDGWSNTSSLNTIGFDEEDYTTQFVSLFKTLHQYIGSFKKAALHTGVSAADIVEDDWTDDILYEDRADDFSGLAMTVGVASDTFSYSDWNTLALTSYTKPPGNAYYSKSKLDTGIVKLSGTSRRWFVGDVVGLRLRNPFGATPINFKLYYSLTADTIPADPNNPGSEWKLVVSTAIPASTTQNYTIALDTAGESGQISFMIPPLDDYHPPYVEGIYLEAGTAGPYDGLYINGNYIKGLLNSLIWHTRSVAVQNTGEIDYANRLTESFARAMTQGYINKMDPVSFTADVGQRQYIGPHHLAYVDDDDPGFYGGVVLKYYGGQQ